MAQFRKEAELANQRREEAELQGDRESNRLSKEATRKVLEAQNESTKALTEVRGGSLRCSYMLHRYKIWGYTAQP